MTITVNQNRSSMNSHTAFSALNSGKFKIASPILAMAQLLKVDQNDPNMTNIGGTTTYSAGDTVINASKGIYLQSPRASMSGADVLISQTSRNVPGTLPYIQREEHAEVLHYSNTTATSIDELTYFFHNPKTPMIPNQGSYDNALIHADNLLTSQMDSMFSAMAKEATTITSLSCNTVINAMNLKTYQSGLYGLLSESIALLDDLNSGIMANSMQKNIILPFDIANLMNKYAANHTQANRSESMYEWGSYRMEPILNFTIGRIYKDTFSCIHMAGTLQAVNDLTIKIDVIETQPRGNTYITLAGTGIQGKTINKGDVIFVTGKKFLRRTYNGKKITDKTAEASRFSSVDLTLIAKETVTATGTDITFKISPNLYDGENVDLKDLVATTPVTIAPSHRKGLILDERYIVHKFFDIAEPTNFKTVRANYSYDVSNVSRDLLALIVVVSEKANGKYMEYTDALSDLLFYAYQNLHAQILLPLTLPTGEDYEPMITVRNFTPATKSSSDTPDQIATDNIVIGADDVQKSSSDTPDQIATDNIVIEADDAQKKNNKK